MPDRVNAASRPRRGKEPERFYLFAGMGGRAARRKHKLILQWSLLAGTVASAAVAAILYLFNRFSH